MKKLVSICLLQLCLVALVSASDNAATKSVKDMGSKKMDDTKKAVGKYNPKSFKCMKDETLDKCSMRFKKAAMKK